MTRAPRILWVIGALLLGPAALRAQSDTLRTELDNLRTPASPGFVILGVEPGSVARPTSPRAVALGLLSAIRDGGDLVPRNFAFEIAPYWLASHPDLTFLEYDDAGPGRTAKQTASISLATTSVASSEEDPESLGIGLGVRTLFAQGRLNRGADTLLQRIDDLQDSILVAETEAEEDRLAEAIRPLALDFQKADHERVGFLLEAAAAISVLFPESRYDEGAVNRIGAWLTPSYRSEGSLQVTGVLRYLRDRESVADADLHLIDSGLRVHYLRGGLDASLEAVARLARKASGEASDSESARVMAIVRYDLTPTFRLTASLGKDHEDPSTGESTMISILGLDIGLARIASVKTPGLP